MDDIVEISKSKLDLLNGVSTLNNALWNDPKVGMVMKERTKELYPNANIPEVDAVVSARKVEHELLTKVEAKEKAIEDRIAAFEAKQLATDEAAKNAQAEKTFSAEIDATKKKYNLTAEGMEKVFARMKEKNNPDVESAAAWVTDHEVKAPVQNSNHSPSNMNLYGSSDGDAEWASLNKNPQKWGDATLTEMINDFQSGNFGKYKEFGGNL